MFYCDDCKKEHRILHGVQEHPTTHVKCDVCGQTKLGWYAGLPFVVIDVLGGVAEVANKSGQVLVIINDHDNNS